MNTSLLTPLLTKVARPLNGNNGVKTAPPAPMRKGVPQIHRNGIMKSQINVLLVDDHPIVRKGVSSSLSKHANIRIAAEAADGKEAIRLAREVKPDVVLMDMDMPQMDGLAVTQTLRAEMPRVKIVILSMHRHTDTILRTLQSGASGYVLKDAQPEQLMQAIETVHGGGTFYSPDIASVVISQLVHGGGEGPSTMNITNREREVLICIAEGLSNKEIAMRLGVGVRTVETHRERIMRKLNIHSVAGLTRFAIANGLISLREDPRT